MLSNNVNQRYQVPMQAMTQAQLRDAMQNGQMSMEGLPIDQEQMRQRVNDNYAVKRTSQVLNKEEQDTYKTALIGVPVWYGLSQSMDYFAKGCRGEYTDTIQYKMGKWGDDVVDSYNNSAFGKSRFSKWINDGFHSSTKFINDKIVSKSAVLRSIRDTPSQPKLDMVKAQSKGIVGQLMLDYPQIAENFVKPLEHAKDLDCYGGSKSFIDGVKSKIASDPKNKLKILQEAEFELLHNYTGGTKLADFKALDVKAKATFLENAKAKAFGFADNDSMKKLLKNAGNNVDEIFDATKKADPKMFSKIWSGGDNWLGKAQGHLFGRNVYASETTNKLIGSGVGNAKYHKTWLGKTVPKVTNVVTEALTNRVAGGKLIAIMQAGFMATAILKTFQAEGAGEKVRTFAERITEMVMLFAGIPLAIQAMHRLGGVQYAGMSDDFAKNALKNIDTKLKGSADEIKAAKKLVAEFETACKNGKKPHEAYRQVLENFNEKSLQGGWSKVEHAGGKKALGYIRKGDTKNMNIITRTLKKGAEVITVGLERVRPYTKKAVGTGFKAKALDAIKNPRHALKYASGFPMRFILGMFVIAPMISEPVIKLTHKIFGKPKDSVLDEDKDEPTVEPPQDYYQPQQPVAEQVELTPAQKAAMIEKYKKLQNTDAVTADEFLAQSSQNSQVSQAQQAIAEPKRTYVPSPMSTIKADGENQTGYVPDARGKIKQDENAEPIRNYIPNQYGVQVDDGDDMTAANDAMKRADAAERRAMEVLKMY
ncbi:MAG: hypothetical protein R3Y28_00100 [Candidatus Gastranaerophilales bacterium]